MSFGGWVGSKANSFVYSLWSTFFLVIGAILLFIGGTASSSGEEWAFLPVWARHCALLLQFGHGSNQSITHLLFQQLEEGGSRLCMFSSRWRNKCNIDNLCSISNPYNTSNLCNTTSLLEKNAERAVQ